MGNGRRASSNFLILLPIVLLGGLILLFLSKMAFSNLILARGDTFLYFYPYWHAAAAALRENSVPFWNPNIFMGAPLLANSQVGFFYPFNWPVWLWLETPYAVKASIILHLFIAGLGTYLAGLKVMRFGRSASLLAAVSFALGGYLTAQVEHVNQLQGLSWLPWFLLTISVRDTEKKHSRLYSLLATAILFSLQLLAGHTQTAFITGVGLLIWHIAQLFQQRINGRQEERIRENEFPLNFVPFAILIGAAALALIITAIQLWPSLELTQLSNRQGGLPANEVLSFSLPPLLLSHTLLPAINQSLFSEYVAFLPLVVLALAMIGAWQWRRAAGVFPALVWVIVGYLLALGVYNPLYWLLARMPGFNLFRAPARWMVLTALGMSLLAGAGWQIFASKVRDRRAIENQDYPEKTLTRPLLFFLGASLLLFIWGLAGQFFVEIIPTGPEVPYETPTLQTIALWIVEWTLLAVIFIFLSRMKMKKWWSWIPGLLFALSIVILYTGSRSLPYNNLTTPEAYFDLRPTVTRLLAETADSESRFLSMSDIYFESGDQVEIDTIYETQLSPAARYDYTVAIKQKEIIAPNLPMIYGLAAVDGFDGGLLPTQSFSQMMELILPEGTETTDGRLREQLPDIPEARWLDLFNTKYLITDKVGDIWRDGVFFDRQHRAELQNGQVLSIGYLPDYEATELRILASKQPGLVNINTSDGEMWELEAKKIDEGLYQVTFPVPATLVELQLSSCVDVVQCELEALTLVDNRDDTFQSIVPGAYRMIHSGDVKIYENMDVMPRAFIVHDWQWVPDMAAAIETMRAQEFDVRQTAVLTIADSELIAPQLQDNANGASRVEIQEYGSDRVLLISETDKDGLLVLTDSSYPGWKAFLDGRPVPIEQANGLFRGVFVPAGRHELVFDLAVQSYNYGRAVSLGGLAVITILIIILAGTRARLDA